MTFGLSCGWHFTPRLGPSSTVSGAQRCSCVPRPQGGSRDQHPGRLGRRLTENRLNGETWKKTRRRIRQRGSFPKQHKYSNHPSWKPLFPFFVFTVSERTESSYTIKGVSGINATTCQSNIFTLY